MIKREEPSLVRSGAKPPIDDHLTRLEHLYPGANGEIANPVARGLQFAGEDRQPEGPLLKKKEEPSLIRKAKYNESLWLGGDHFWPIFEGPSSVAIKRDEPDRVPDAPVSGDGDDVDAGAGADGKIRMCCFGGDWWSQVRTIRTTEWTIARTSVGSSAAMCARMDLGSDASGCLSVGR